MEQEKGMLAKEQPKIPMFKNWAHLSSQVRSTNYNQKDKYMLVEFMNGGRYKYSDVPLEVWVQSLNTVSIGKFINTTIKPNYSVTKL